MEHIDIGYTAKLARLELSKDEQELYSAQLGRILEYFHVLSSVDTSGVEPTAHANPLHNVLREDVAVPGFGARQALANAPQQREDQVLVPRVIE